MKVHASHHTSSQEFEVISAIELGIYRKDGRVLSNCPKSLLLGLSQSLGKRVVKSTKEGWKEAGKKKKISFFLWRLSYFVLTLAEVVALHTRENFCEKRAGEKAVVSPSFPATAPSTDHTSLSLASLCFRDVPTIYEPETDNRYTGKINPRIKSFFHLHPHSFSPWLVAN